MARLQQQRTRRSAVVDAAATSSSRRPRQQLLVSMKAAILLVTIILVSLLGGTHQRAGRGLVQAFMIPVDHQQTRTTTPVLARRTTTTITTSSQTTSTTTTLFAKSRKARRMQKEEISKSRPKQFFDAIDDANDEDTVTGTLKKEKKKKKKRRDGVDDDDDDDDEPVAAATAASTTTPTSAISLEQQAELDADAARRKQINDEAEARFEKRPDVSTMIVDEETGIEVVAQGKHVMDVVTRQAVKLSDLGPEYRLAQMFPGVPPNVREQYRFADGTGVADMIESLREVCSVKGELPSHPSIANKALDFVLANRDLLGYKMKRTIGRVTMREASLGNEEQARANNKLWKHFLTIENHLSAPFRQMMMDAEGRLGPNFGNLDVMSYCDGPLYERCANYLVLKSMVVNWEKKVKDAEYYEKTPQTQENYLSVMGVGDPRRYLPDPPILTTLRECTQVCYMSQQLTKAFVERAELFDDLPPELRFLEKALAIRGGTPLRQFMIEEFCPQEQITPEALREGMTRLLAQIENMQTDPYGDLFNIVAKLIKAMSAGTAAQSKDPYAEYLANVKGDATMDGPGAFQTYTFNHEKLSLVRFLDNQYERDGGGGVGGAQPQNMFDMMGGAGAGGGNLFDDLFGGGDTRKPSPSAAMAAATASTSTDASDEEGTYKVPAARAIGRPHEMGWLDILGEPDDDTMRLGKVPAGRIIPDDE